ncbi:hypothetical protein NE237_020142 [Protea cynaroides]|uniref:VQ domain-containing protein n=1 Tax=Protea cynaroides TaxID=273540 RepID=A0A9Q0H5G8_9MAGN|nr:hypothetical protein NE237_020142 [Protea cynaroides]
MSPGQQARKEINGPRPFPLKINKGSHLIKKSSSSSLSFDGISEKHHHRPIIIYTHSPKIIHTQAHDFMALVQKLTGFSCSDDHRKVQPQSLKDNNITMKPPSAGADHEDNKLSSVLTIEKSEDGGGRGEIQVTSSSSVSPLVYGPPMLNPLYSDMPLFTPNSANFFCSPRPLYRYPDSLLTPSNMGNFMSPSFLEVMKEFQGY